MQRANACVMPASLSRNLHGGRIHPAITRPLWRSLYNKAANKHSRRLSLYQRRIDTQMLNTQVTIIIILLTVCAQCTQHMRRIRTVLPRSSFNFQKHYSTLSNNLFRRMYRVSKNQFNIIQQLVHEKLVRYQRNEACVAKSVPVPVMLCVTLRLLAGASYLDVGWPYGIAESTVFHVFHQTLYALNQNLPQIQFPTTEEECSESALLFQQKRKSPFMGIIAALDGVAIKIRQPRLCDAPDPRKYYNRKKFFAICVQAAVRADYKFCFLSARHAGGTHDATAFGATMLYQLLKGDQMPAWAVVVADEAYANEHRVVTPYPGRGLSVMKDSFNAYHSSCRVSCEQAFGMLVSRFGIFWSALRYSLKTVTLIIMVAAKLHNFIIDNADSFLYENVPPHDENRVIGSPVIHFQDMCHTERDTMRSRVRGREHSNLRDVIAERLYRLGVVRRRSFTR